MSTHHLPYIDPLTALHGPPPDDRPERFVEPERMIAASLREHEPREGEALAAYEALVERCDDEAVRYLAQLIVEDERRHHRVIGEMLHQIETFLWEVDREPRVPYLTTRVDPGLRDALDRLLEIERDDVRELRRLRKQVRGQTASSLLPLLVEMMEHDTSKHIAILKVLRAHTKRR